MKITKLILLSILVFAGMQLIPGKAIAQSDYIYTYDAAGNRIGRTFELGRMILPPSDTSARRLAVDTKHDINVAPNPTTGKVTINITNLGKDETGTITVVDMNTVS